MSFRLQAKRSNWSKSVEPYERDSVQNILFILYNVTSVETFSAVRRYRGLKKNMADDNGKFQILSNKQLMCLIYPKYEILLYIVSYNIMSGNCMNAMTAILA